jgi:predicted transcriptional regulator
MAKKQSTPVSPAEFELQILGVLWEYGPATVRQVMERLSDGKERAYTSVLSVMQVMQKKGLVEVDGERDGLAHIYHPLVSRGQIATPMLKGLVTRIFGGRTSVAMQHLLNADEINRDEINEMRKLLDELESRQKKDRRSKS